MVAGVVLGGLEWVSLAATAVDFLVWVCRLRGPRKLGYGAGQVAGVGIVGAAAVLWLC